MRSRHVPAFCALIICVILAGSGRAGRATPPNGEAQRYSEIQITLGRKLVSFGGCNDCHTPWAFDPEIGAPIPDMSRLLSGHPEGAPTPGGTLGEADLAVIGPTFTSFLMPFGVVYSPNLTPDPDTGMGTWTEEMFLDVFRKAKHMGGNGRPVLPPMPWAMSATLPEEDLVAMFAYLHSIAPIRNSVPVAQPPHEVQSAIDASNQKLLARLRQQH
jgi:hypothetical protein